MWQPVLSQDVLFDPNWWILNKSAWNTFTHEETLCPNWYPTPMVFGITKRLGSSTAAMSSCKLRPYPKYLATLWYLSLEESSWTPTIQEHFSHRRLRAGDANEPSTSKSTRTKYSNPKATSTEDHPDFLPGTRHKTTKEPKTILIQNCKLRSITRLLSGNN